MEQQLQLQPMDPSGQITFQKRFVLMVECINTMEQVTLRLNIQETVLAILCMVPRLILQVKNMWQENREMQMFRIIIINQIKQNGILFRHMQELLIEAIGLQMIMFKQVQSFIRLPPNGTQQMQQVQLQMNYSPLIPHQQQATGNYGFLIHIFRIQAERGQTSLKQVQLGVVWVTIRVRRLFKVGQRIRLCITLPVVQTRNSTKQMRILVRYRHTMQAHSFRHLTAVLLEHPMRMYRLCLLRMGLAITFIKREQTGEKRLLILQGMQ